MRYQVLDNGKSADYRRIQGRGDKSLEKHLKRLWATSIFDSFGSAREYAWKWLGPCGGSNDGKTGHDLQPNIPWDYSGYGDTIEIREIS